MHRLHHLLLLLLLVNLLHLLLLLLLGVALFITVLATIHLHLLLQFLLLKQTIRYSQEEQLQEIIEVFECLPSFSKVGSCFARPTISSFLRSLDPAACLIERASKLG